ncbi:MAG: DUF6398 domain-containing protein [Treponema sp.]|nr:DUF6398 domain-containing protein [Treponema sp.]
MSIPENMRGKYEEIAPLISKFCNEKLNDEYQDLCLRLLEKLCRKRPSPLLGGRPKTWAAGIIYAIGTNNFIFDKTQKLHLTSGEIASAFGISSSTAGSKANEIKKMFRIDYFNPEWQLQEYLKDNPAIWMVMVNGFIVDIRDMPLETQQQAFEMGIIPYVPGERTDITKYVTKSEEQVIVNNQQEPKKKKQEESKEQLNFMDLF